MLSEQDFINAASVIGCDVAAIKAVTYTESGRKGFYDDGIHCILKFEGHKFHEFTKGVYDKLYPTLSYPSWTEKYSAFGPASTGALAYERFNRAYALDQRAALMACSWGMFQIMGEHYAECGYRNVGDFVTAMRTGELSQLLVFAQFVKRTGLAKWLIGLNTTDPAKQAVAAAGFALRYNGGSFAKNHYDTTILKYYKQFKPAA